MLTSIDGSTFCRMIVCAANCLEEHKQEVDEMNVFPVPDGDTGTNMSMTVMSAAKEVRSLYMENNEASIPQMAKALSSGALRGARGNSGVITSQLFRGLYRGLKEADEVGTGVFAQAMNRGVETAYKAVMRPKEGTILTVAREMASFALNHALNTEDMDELLETSILHGEEVLQQTPEMLSVLKEAGVVDAGGAGFLYVFKGMLQGLRMETEEIPELITGGAKKEASAAAQAEIAPESIKFGYCTEFIIDGVKYPEKHEAMLREYLNNLGDSLVLVTDENMIKIHVHTNDPGLVIQKGLSLGSLINIKIDNMRMQHRNILELSEKEQAPEPKPALNEPPKEIGFITVAVGDGIASLFKDLGVDDVIPGGQTMNPSTEDVLNAIDRVNAKNIVVLPNNKNIVLAAQQAADLSKEKKVYVVRSCSIPQGITAMLNYGISENIEENVESMKESLSTVMTGQVTFAVRDTHLNDHEIHKDDILAILDDEVCAAGTDLKETTCELLNAMMDAGAELVTIYYGQDADPEQTDALEAYLHETYPDVEVEIHEGGQPLYYYIISAE